MRDVNLWMIQFRLAPHQTEAENNVTRQWARHARHPEWGTPYEETCRKSPSSQVMDVLMALMSVDLRA